MHEDRSPVVVERSEAKEYTEGHRERLRARYRLSGEAALQDYELLELLLTFAIPRREIKSAPHMGKGLHERVLKIYHRVVDYPP
jgi:DNA repair protein RadC